MKATRIAGLAGIATVLLVIADAIAAGSPPRETASTEKILAYYASRSHWHRQELALVLGALSMVFFLTFLGGLRSALRSAEPSPLWLPTVVLAAGVVFAVLFASLSTMRGTIAFALDGSHAFRSAPLDPQLVRALEVARSLFYVHALVAGAVMIGASSVVAVGRRLVPAALAWTSLVLALVVLVGAFISTAVVFLLLLWIIGVASALSVKTTVAPTG